MTALRMPARPGQDDASMRPVPWRRMAGVTWRQHRTALAGVAVLLGALAVYEWLTGESLQHAWAAVIACHPASSPACQNLVMAFPENLLSLGSLLQVVPALTGAFAGAPVLARELETGTFRFAWTQGFDRWRWALAKLAALAVVLAAATFAFSVLVSWCYQPFLGASNQDLGIYGNSPLVTVFSLREVAFPAWTLAVFAIGVLAGTLIRRVVPAIAATLAVYGGLALATTLWLREHYMTPLLTSRLDVPDSAWIVSQWYTKGGKFAFGAHGPQIVSAVRKLCSGGTSGLSPAQCLTQHGYTQWASYQPGSRFWPFQLIEGGWLLALSVLLIATTVWLVRRRAA